MTSIFLSNWNAATDKLQETVTPWCRTYYLFTSKGRKRHIQVQRQRWEEEQSFTTKIMMMRFVWVSFFSPLATNVWRRNLSHISLVYLTPEACCEDTLHSTPFSPIHYCSISLTYISLRIPFPTFFTGKRDSCIENEMDNLWADVYLLHLARLYSEPTINTHYLLTDEWRRIEDRSTGHQIHKKWITMVL